MQQRFTWRLTCLIFVLILSISCAPAGDDDDAADDDAVADDDGAADDDDDDADDDAADDDVLWEYVSSDEVEVGGATMLTDGFVYTTVQWGDFALLFRLWPYASPEIFPIGARLSAGPLAADGSEFLHTLLQDEVHGGLVYLNNVAGDWAAVWKRSDAAAGDLAVSADGTAHVAFVSADRRTLYYATNAGGSFAVEQVDAATGEAIIPSVSIALDSAGRPHLAYPKGLYPNQDTTPEYYGVLTHAVRDGSWTTEALTGADTTWNTALAIDADDAVHLAFGTFLGNRRTYNGQTRYLTNRGGAWQTPTVVDLGNSGRDEFRLFVDADRAAHLFFHIGIWQYSANTGGAWHPMEAFPDVLALTAASDPGGFFHVIASQYYEQEHLMYLTLGDNETGAFAWDTVGFTRKPYGDIGAVIDGQDRIQVGFAMGDYEYWYAAMFAEPEAGGWRNTALPDSNWAYTISLALDEQNRVHFAHDGLGLVYGQRLGDGWAYETLVDGWVRAPSLAIDANGAAHLAFVRFENLDSFLFHLWYATNASGAWTEELIDADGDNPTLVLDADGKAHVVYVDERHDQTKYATNAGGAWQVTVVHEYEDNFYEPAMNADLALDADGHAHTCLSYYLPFTAEMVHYATNAGGAWQEEVVNSSEGGGRCSLAVDSGGVVHFVYSSHGSVLDYRRRQPAGTWQNVAIQELGDRFVADADMRVLLDSQERMHLVLQADNDVMIYHAP